MGWHNLSKRANLQESQTRTVGEGGTAFRPKSICCTNGGQESKVKAVVWLKLEKYFAVSQ